VRAVVELTIVAIFFDDVANYFIASGLAWRG
jgi:hypothetical protein